jgi:Tol biopolymer transport system component
MIRRVGATVLFAVIVAACSSPGGQATSTPTVSSTPGPSPTPAAFTPTPRPAPGSTPKLAPVLPGEPWIAYQAQGADGFGIHVVRTDGTESQAPLPDVPGTVQEHPDWSPDGTRLLLTVTEAEDAGGETEDVWIAEVGSWRAEKLIDCEAPCLWVDEPAWSPDGGSMVFHRLVEENGMPVSTLEIMDIAEGESRVVLIAPTGQAVLAPRWSPDGRSVVVEVLQLADGTTDAAVVGEGLGVVDLAAATPAIRALVPVDRFANNPDWSPAGDLIVFSAPAEGGEPGGRRSDLWVVRPDGTGLAQVTDLAAAGGTAIHPTFTPDGERIVFVMDDFETALFGIIGEVRIDGGGLGAATTGPVVTGIHPRLRPTP